MISIEEAKALIRNELNDDVRFKHSLAVASFMKTLAEYFNEDTEIWYLTGLLHDIDLPKTKNNLKLHGIIAAEKLKGLLPETAIRAIKSHDYRTGIDPESELAEALIFSDMLEIMSRVSGKEDILTCRKNNSWDALADKHSGFKHHINILKSYFTKHKLIAF